MRFELTTSTLARLRSTPELHPQTYKFLPLLIVYKVILNEVRLFFKVKDKKIQKIYSSQISIMFFDNYVSTTLN